MKTSPKVVFGGMNHIVIGGLEIVIVSVKIRAMLGLCQIENAPIRENAGNGGVEVRTNPSNQALSGKRKLQKKRLTYPSTKVRIPALL